MLTYPQIDPVLLSLGPLKVHWYGMMYLFGFMLAYWLAFGRSKRSDSPVKPEQVEDLILYGAMGVVLGGRIGYVFFYGFDQFLHDPLWLFRVWDGGMSFHGGLLGVMVAMWLYALKIKNDFVNVMDFIAPMVPVGLGFGRIGNFINQELWGRSTDVSWAMIFPNDPFMLPRHPSQLYQAALEGVLLFIILFSFSRKSRPRYAVSGLFLFCYGVFRFVVEFFREPDTQIGYELFGWMTRGQELCMPMIASGLFLLWYAYRHVHESVTVTTAVVAEVIAVDEVVVEKKPVRSKPKTTPVKKTTSVKKENKTTKAAIQSKSKTAKEKEVKKKK